MTTLGKEQIIEFEEKSGFLPTIDPLCTLPSQYGFLDDIITDLPELIMSNQFRDIICHLPLINYDLDELDLPILRRLRTIYAFFAAAWVHAPKEIKVVRKRLPKQIAGPLAKLSEIYNINPVLNYHSLCLENWYCNKKPYCCEPADFELQFRFTRNENEDYFPLIYLSIESYSGELISQFNFLSAALRQAKIDQVEVLSYLESIYLLILEVNLLYGEIGTQCNFTQYREYVSRYHTGFRDVVFEGEYNESPQTFCSDIIWRQSNLIYLIESYFNVSLECMQGDGQTLLRHMLSNTNDYFMIPQPHRKYLKDSTNHRRNLKKILAGMRNPKINEMYNRCIRSILDYRIAYVFYMEKCQRGFNYEASSRHLTDYFDSCYIK